MSLWLLAATGLSTTPEPSAVLGASRLLSTLAALLVVLAAIAALAWFLKRFNLAGATSTRSIKVIDVLAIGQRERLVVVDWEGQRLLLACGNGSVTQVAQHKGEGSTPLAPDFASRLQVEQSEAACIAQ